MKLQHACSNVTPVGHIILISTQPVFALTPELCMLCGDANNTNFSLYFDPTVARTHDIPHSR
jgi:hypothetical protein